MGEQDQPTAQAVAAVVTGDAIHAVAVMTWLRAYRTWGQTGMKLARNLHPTVRDWNAAMGTTCRTRAEVGASADAVIKRIDAERNAK